MNINFQSDSSESNISSAFSSDDDDIPSLNVQNKSNYDPKNVEKAISNQCHDLVIGEIASAHFDTLQTTFAGFPKNTELESGFKHKSRNEVAIESAKNIMPDIEQYLSGYLNSAIQNAVGLSIKNYGADFVKSKNSDEEDEEVKKEEEDNEEDENEKVIDQEITLNSTKEDKKPAFLKNLKSLFNKTSSNDNSNNSLNDSSSSWWPKPNIKRSQSVGPKSNTLFLNFSVENKNDTDENITESEEKSNKKKFFNSFPFFKQKNDDGIENNEDEQNSFQNTDKENSSPKSNTARNPSPKNIFKNIFTKPKESSENQQRTVRFADFDEGPNSNSNSSDNSNLSNNSNLSDNSQLNGNSNLNGSEKVGNQESILRNSNQPIEKENCDVKPITVAVENIDDFSSPSLSCSESDSDPQKCHTPDSMPDVEADPFEVQDSEQGSEAEIVRNILRPPTPDKELNANFSSESDQPGTKRKSGHDDKKELTFDSDSNSDSPPKIDAKNNISFLSAESKSTKDQDLLLSASESESEAASSVHNNNGSSNERQSNKAVKNQIEKKAKKPNFFDALLSSSYSELDESDDQKSSSKQQAKDKEADLNGDDQIGSEKEKETKSSEKGENECSLQDEDEMKPCLSNVEFIANELSDFELDHETIKTDFSQSGNKSAKSRPSSTYDGADKSAKNKLSNNDNGADKSARNNRFSNPINRIKKVPLKISNQSSQTSLQNSRNQNSIEVNTYFEVYEGTDTIERQQRRRIKRRRRKVEASNSEIQNEIEYECEKEEIEIERIKPKRPLGSNDARSHSRNVSNSSSPNSPKGRTSLNNSNSSSPNSPKGRSLISSNSSSPDSPRRRSLIQDSNSSSPASPKGRGSYREHAYSPVHTHTHTPVPVKPRLILKNSSDSGGSSSGGEDEDAKASSLRARSKPPRRPKRSDSVKTQSKRQAAAEADNDPTSTATLSPSPPPPAIRKKRPQQPKTAIKSRTMNSDNIRARKRPVNDYDDDYGDDIDGEKVTPKAVPHSPVVRQERKAVKRKKRASSEKRPPRIKSMNPQLSISANANEGGLQHKSRMAGDEDEELRRTQKKRAAKKKRSNPLSSTLPSRVKQSELVADETAENDEKSSSRRRKVQRAAPLAKSGPVSRLRRSNSSELSRPPKAAVSSIEAGAKSSRSQLLNSGKSRRLSVDNSMIDRKALAKNGVRSIILIEFDKKTPIIENFLEQISSNPGALSQSSPYRKRPANRAGKGSRQTSSFTDDGYDDDDFSDNLNFNSNDTNTKSSTLSSGVKPKIAKRNRSKVVVSRSRKKEVFLGTNSSSNDDDGYGGYDNEESNFARNKPQNLNRNRKRQNSVKPSSLNRTVVPLRKNSEFSENDARVSKTVREADLKMTCESENVIVHRPLKKVKKNGKKRMESVKSDMALKRSVDENEDYRSIKFNFKKLFDDAERNERIENSKK